MASAERIDESDILFLQEEQPRWIINIKPGAVQTF